MSSSSVSRDREKRTAPSSAAIGTFIAFSTCDGACEPAEQAAPVETATPSRASIVATASASTPAQAIALVFGRRSALAPSTAASGMRADEAAFEPVAQRAHARRVAAQARDGDLGRLAEADDARDVLGAAAAGALLPAAVNQRLELEAPAHIERSDALGPMQLVRRERQEIDRAALEMDRLAPGRLHGVGVKDRADRLRFLGESLDWKDDARFRCSPT